MPDTMWIYSWTVFTRSRKMSRGRSTICNDLFTVSKKAPTTWSR